MSGASGEVSGALRGITGSTSEASGMSNSFKGSADDAAYYIRKSLSTGRKILDSSLIGIYGLVLFWATLLVWRISQLPSDPNHFKQAKICYNRSRFLLFILLGAPLAIIGYEMAEGAGAGESVMWSGIQLGAAAGASVMTFWSVTASVKRLMAARDVEEGAYEVVDDEKK